MGVGAGLCMYDVVVKKFTFAISSPDEFFCYLFPWSHLHVRSDDGFHARWLKGHVVAQRCAILGFVDMASHLWHSLASHDYSHLRHIYWRRTSCCNSCGCL